MTPEKAQYNLLMLRLGHSESYDRELDRILEEKDPLPPLILDLAVCMSDLNGTISVLREYLIDHPADQQQVYDMVLADLRRKYMEEHLSPAGIVELMWNITRIIRDPCEDPWWQLYSPIDDHDLINAGFFTEASFEAALTAFLNGEDWSHQQLIQPKKRRSILDLFRRKGEKS